MAVPIRDVKENLQLWVLQHQNVDVNPLKLLKDFVEWALNVKKIGVFGMGLGHNRMFYQVQLGHDIDNISDEEAIPIFTCSINLIGNGNSWTFRVDEYTPGHPTNSTKEYFIETLGKLVYCFTCWVNYLEKGKTEPAELSESDLQVLKELKNSTKTQNTHIIEKGGLMTQCIDALNLRLKRLELSRAREFQST